MAKGVQKPVLVVTDGHTSRFSLDSISYLFSNTTIGSNQSVPTHTHYRKSKKNIFSNNMTIDKEEFMSILAEIWPTWPTSESIQKAAKLVGVSKDGLNIDWKFDKAEIQSSRLQQNMQEQAKYSK